MGRNGVAAAPARRTYEIRLLGDFRLIAESGELRISGASERLLAFLALRKSWVRRGLVAGTLWPDTSEARAHASLRSALARMEATVRPAVEVTPEQIRLSERVAVDVVRSRSLAQRLVDPNREPAPTDVNASAIALLSADLLPDWYDEWVVVDVEEWRQLRLHALDMLATALIARRLFADAARAALAAIKADPLRESPHALLVQVHLAEGNRSEALREYTRYRALLRSEIGISPSPALRTLLTGLETAARHMQSG
jgi:DNA-binding SARP family transcriptional activator